MALRKKIICSICVFSLSILFLLGSFAQAAPKVIARNTATANSEQREEGKPVRMQLPTATTENGIIESIYTNMPKLLGFTDKVVSYPLVYDEEIAHLDTLYRKGQAKEQHNINITAIRNYEELIRYGTGLLQKNKKLSDAKVCTVLTYLISATYRIGIVTDRSMKGNMFNLYDQLGLYKETGDMINDVLSLIADIKYERRLKISKSLYGMLYYARGYNKLSLAKTLLYGDIWKKYTIYMPGDIVELISSSINDMSTMLDFCNLSRDAVQVINGRTATDNASLEPLIDNYLVNYLAFIDNLNYETKTLQLSYYTADKKYIKDVIKKRIVNNIYPLLDYYNSKEVQKLFSTSRTITKIDDITAIPPELINVVTKLYGILQR